MKKPRKNSYGLYAVRSQISAAPVTIPTQSTSAKGGIYQLNDVIDLPSQKSNLLADVRVLDEPEEGQQVPDVLSPISEQGSLDIAPPEITATPSTINLPSAQHAQGYYFQHQDGMVNHLDIDSDEFQVAVNVPRLGMDRMLDSAMLHCKLNDLLERGLIPHETARAAFRQAQQNRIVR